MAGLEQAGLASCRSRLLRRSVGIDPQRTYAVPTGTAWFGRNQNGLSALEIGQGRADIGVRFALTGFGPKLLQGPNRPPSAPKISPAGGLRALYVTSYECDQRTHLTLRRLKLTPRRSLR